MIGPLPIDPFERDALAAEIALGLVGGPDPASSAANDATDPAFAALVEAWRVRLAPLDDTAPVVPTGPALWNRVRASAGATAQERAPALRESRPEPARQREAARTGGLFAELWSSLPVWRGLGLAGALASLALAVGLVTAVETARRAPVLVAVMLTDANRPAAVVNTFADGRTEFVPLEAIAIPHGHALEVWTHAKDATVPISVGLLRDAQSARLRVDNLPRLGRDQVFAVSVEPTGGSPTGLPTGPVLLKGSAAVAL